MMHHYPNQIITSGRVAESDASVLLPGNISPGEHDGHEFCG